MISLKQATFKYWIKIYCYNNAFIRLIKHNIKCELLSNMMLLVCSPYILFNYWFTLLYEKLWGIKKVGKLMNADKEKHFKYEFAIVVISKNEGPYVREWIEFHRIAGADKFYFYDNDSDDDTEKKLNPYIKEGIVEYTKILGKGRQIKAYNDAIKRHKNECRWMAFIDMDEFLMPTDYGKKLNKVVEDIVYSAGGGAAGVGVNWAIYGTSGFKKKQTGLIIENYRYRAENEYYLNFHIKCVCNPRLVVNYISPHYPLYIRGGYSVKEAYGSRITGWGANRVIYKNLRINHYYTKSEEEYLKKCARGLGDRVGIYPEENFELYNKNDVYDFTISPYIIMVRERLKNISQL